LEPSNSALLVVPAAVCQSDDQIIEPPAGICSAGNVTFAVVLAVTLADFGFCVPATSRKPAGDVYVTLYVPTGRVFSVAELEPPVGAGRFALKVLPVLSDSLAEIDPPAVAPVSPLTVTWMLPVAAATTSTTKVTVVVARPTTTPVRGFADPALTAYPEGGE